MQITETVNEGLRREYKIIIAANDLDSRLSGKLTEMAPKVNLRGFRPGKAPVSYLKRAYGKSMMSEVVEDVVNQSGQQVIKDNDLKPAFPPRVDLVSEIEKVVDGASDLEFLIKVDLMPEFELTDLSQVKVEKLTAEVTDAEIDEALNRLAEQGRTFSARDGVAENGDLLVINFVGRTGGEEFEGGKADDFNLTLGSGQFIPGFEDQLIGVKVGEERLVKVTFPADYGSEKLAGQDAEFTVTVKEVKLPDPITLDDKLAENFGLENLANMKDRVRDQLKSDFARASRLHLKRRILDALDQAHSFELPPTMVAGEFEGIWKQVQDELAREGKSAEDEGKSEDDLKKEYQTIAERRVRLGLVLARIGEQNGVAVQPNEVQQAIAQRARQFPGQEQRVFEFYTRNAQAMNEIRAPIFEDKVVDFIAELAQVNDRMVDRETLFLDPDEAAEKLGK